MAWSPNLVHIFTLAAGNVEGLEAPQQQQQQQQQQRQRRQKRSRKAGDNKKRKGDG